MSTPRTVVLLGSTGSIGTQAIDLVRANPGRFRVVAIGAGGGDVELLAAQALALEVDAVGVARASVVQDLQLAFYAEAARRGCAAGDFKIPKILAGPGHRPHQRAARDQRLLVGQGQHPPGVQRG